MVRGPGRAADRPVLEHSDIELHSDNRSGRVDLDGSLAEVAITRRGEFIEVRYLALWQGLDRGWQRNHRGGPVASEQINDGVVVERLHNPELE